MNPLLVASLLSGYFILLIFVAYLTSRYATTDTFFTANRKSPWFVVAFGMIGTTISGVTFISVPGEVGNSAFTYFQFILGNFVGYMVVAFILLPVYYRLNLISIYTYLEERLGFYAYKSGSFYFLLSRTIGAAFRMYLVAEVLQLAFFAHFGIPFGVTVLISILLIWIYTTKGGVKTIIWTDSLQTIFLISAVVLTIYFIFNSLGWSFGQMIQQVQESPHSKVFDWDWRSGRFFVKQFLAGIFITIVMSGLDQDMMQKNLTCKNLKEAQKNMLTFSAIFVAVVWMFLTLGALLYIYAASHQIELPIKSDDLYPLLAINHMNLMIGIFFLLGITAANYASADSALTSLTTAFCIDFLNFGKHEDQNKKRLLKITHIGFSLLLFFVIMIFKAVNNQSVVMAVFKVAGLTYGPLLGLFAFGMLTKLRIKDHLVPMVVIAAPLLSWLLNNFSEQLLNGYQIGFELIIINGAFTFLGLFLIRIRQK
ncbi:MAG: sodium:solute symporter [Prolixibacteraceae bacterium]|jgi:SSS family transporter|nr:sodium:solute symporter [Prolixibacteraceae bacterium]